MDRLPLPLGVFLTFILMLSTPTAEARPFTDATGRTIEAELDSYVGDNITLRKGSQSFTVPISKFSEADQDFIREWIAANPTKTGYRFNVMVDLDEDFTGRGYADGMWYEDKLKYRPHNYNVLVMNQTEATIENVVIRYEIYINDVVDVETGDYGKLATGGKATDKLQTIAGMLTNKTIPANGRIEFERDFVIQDYVDRDGGRVDEAARDKVIGIRVRVFNGTTMIFEQERAIDSKRMQGAVWQNAGGEETKELEK